MLGHRPLKRVRAGNGFDNDEAIGDRHQSDEARLELDGIAHPSAFESRLELFAFGASGADADVSGAAERGAPAFPVAVSVAGVVDGEDRAAELGAKPVKDTDQATSVLSAVFIAAGCVTGDGVNHDQADGLIERSECRCESLASILQQADREWVAEDPGRSLGHLLPCGDTLPESLW